MAAPMILLLCSTTAAHAALLAIALNSADGTISLIDTETYQVTGKATVCKEPHHLMPTPDEKSVVIACAASNQLVFFDPTTGQEQKRIRNISDPYQLGYSPNRKWFVATSLRLDRVDLYDPTDFRLLARLPAPKTPSHMAFDDGSQFVFVTLQDSNEVMAISLGTQKIVWVMPVAATPAGIVMSPDNRYLLVACMGEGVVEVIDWRYPEERQKGADRHRRPQPAAEGRRAAFLRFEPLGRWQYFAARYPDHDRRGKIRCPRWTGRHDGSRRRQGTLGDGTLRPQGTGH
jgi:WD40 repeat protein